MRLEISLEAGRDIEEIYLYGFMHFGEKQADIYAHKLEDCFQIIMENPHIGRLDNRVNPAIHRMEYESHVLFYDVYETKISIVRILHKSMDFIKYF